MDAVCWKARLWLPAPWERYSSLGLMRLAHGPYTRNLVVASSCYSALFCDSPPPQAAALAAAASCACAADFESDARALAGAKLLQLTKKEHRSEMAALRTAGINAAGTKEALLLSVTTLQRLLRAMRVPDAAAEALAGAIRSAQMTTAAYLLLHLPHVDGFWAPVLATAWPQARRGARVSGVVASGPVWSRSEAARPCASGAQQLRRKARHEEQVEKGANLERAVQRLMLDSTLATELVSGVGQIQLVCMMMGEEMPYRLNWCPPESAHPGDGRAHQRGCTLLGSQNPVVRPPDCSVCVCAQGAQGGEAPKYVPVGPGRPLAAHQVGQPLDITQLVRAALPAAQGGPIAICVNAERGAHSYAFGVRAVKRLSVSELRPLLPRPPTLEGALQRRAAQAEAEARAQGLQVSSTVVRLHCPLSGAPITTPARFADACNDVLFDLDAMLAVACRSGRWACPVSLRLSRMSELEEDPWAAAVLGALAAAGLRGSVEEVEAAPDGRWRPRGASLEAHWVHPLEPVDVGKLRAAAAAAGAAAAAAAAVAAGAGARAAGQAKGRAAPGGTAGGTAVELVDLLSSDSGSEAPKEEAEEKADKGGTPADASGRATPLRTRRQPGWQPAQKRQRATPHRPASHLPASGARSSPGRAAPPERGGAPPAVEVVCLLDDDECEGRPRCRRARAAAPARQQPEAVVPSKEAGSSDSGWSSSEDSDWDDGWAACGSSLSSSGSNATASP